MAKINIEIVQYYATLINQENQIENNRINWLLVIQGFLFAAISSEHIPKQMTILVPILAIGISVITLIKVSFAHIAIAILVEKYSNTPEACAYPVLIR